MKRKYFLLLLVIICGVLLTGCEKKTKLVENKDYFVKGEYEGKYLDVSKRGYYIDTLNQPNAPYFYIVCMGEKGHIGYNLKVKEVNKSKHKTEVIIEEIAPNKGETLEYTNATLIIEFPSSQKNITIKNTKGEEYKRLTS